MIHLWWVCALTLEFGNFSANLNSSNSFINSSDSANPNIYIYIYINWVKVWALLLLFSSPLFCLKKKLFYSFSCIFFKQSRGEENNRRRAHTFTRLIYIYILGFALSELFIKLLELFKFVEKFPKSNVNAQTHHKWIIKKSYIFLSFP